MNKVLLRIRTKTEIFGCDEFPIVFPSYHELCRWLSKNDNHRLIDRILAIFDYYPVN